MNAALTQESRKAIAALERLIRLEEISVADAARHLKKTPAWIKENFPVIYHSRKSQSVRLADIEAHQTKRTVCPGRRH
jgi:hypothetical protein